MRRFGAVSEGKCKTFCSFLGKFATKFEIKMATKGVEGQEGKIFLPQKSSIHYFLLRYRQYIDAGRSRIDA